MLIADVRAIFDQKVRAGLFNSLRYHAQRHIADDRLQDALGMTWLYFLGGAERGELISDHYLYVYCSLRVRERGPRFARSGEPARGREMVCLDDTSPRELVDHATGDLDETIDRMAAVATLTQDELDLLVVRAEGDELDAIGDANGQSRGWTCRRVQRAREKLRKHYER